MTSVATKRRSAVSHWNNTDVRSWYKQITWVGFGVMWCTSIAAAQTRPSINTGVPKFDAQAIEASCQPVNGLESDQSRYHRALQIGALQVLGYQEHVVNFEVKHVYGSVGDNVDRGAVRQIYRADLALLAQSVRKMIDFAELKHYERQRVERAMYGDYEIVRRYLFTAEGKDDYQRRPQAVINQIVVWLSGFGDIAVLDGQYRISGEFVQSPVPDLKDDASIEGLDFVETKVPFDDSVEGPCGLSVYCIDLEKDILASLSAPLFAAEVNEMRLAQLREHIEAEAAIYDQYFNFEFSSLPWLHASVNPFETLADVVGRIAGTEGVVNVQGLSTEQLDNYIYNARLALRSTLSSIEGARQDVMGKSVGDAKELAMLLDVREVVLMACPDLQGVAASIDAEWSITEKMRFVSTVANLGMLFVTLAAPPAGAVLGLARSSSVVQGLARLPHILRAVRLLLQWGPKLFIMGHLAANASLYALTYWEWQRAKRFQTFADAGVWTIGLMHQRVADAQRGLVRSYIFDIGLDFALDVGSIGARRWIMPKVLTLTGNLRATAKHWVGSLVGRVMAVGGTMGIELSSSDLYALIRRLWNTTESEIKALSTRIQRHDPETMALLLPAQYPNAVPYWAMAEKRDAIPALTRGEIYNLGKATGVGYVGRLSSKTLPVFQAAVQARPDDLVARFALDEQGVWIISADCAAAVAGKLGSSITADDVQNMFVEGNTQTLSDGYLVFRIDGNAQVMLVDGMGYNDAIPQWLADARGIERSRNNNPSVLEFLPEGIGYQLEAESVLNLLSDKQLAHMLVGDVMR